MIKVKFFYMHVNRHDDPMHPEGYQGDKELMEYINQYHIHDQSYTYEDLHLTCEQDYDYAVVIDTVFYKDFFDKSKTIIFRCEPNLLCKNFPEYYNNIDMKRAQYLKSYDMLGIWECIGNGFGINDKLLYDYKFNKTKTLSSIISNLNWHDLHRKRVNFLYKLDALPYFDHYGREYGCVPEVKFANLKSHRGVLDSKITGMADYKYHFNADNVREANTFSERVTQSLIMECLLFYDGCTNLESFIDERAFIKVNLDDQEKALWVIKNAIENDEYSKRIDIIKQEKIKVLDELNIMKLTYNGIKGIKNYWE